MSSTATSRLRLDKQATGDNPNAWGVRLNAALDLIDESAGVAPITVAADVVLSSNNFSSDQARRTVLKFAGVGGFSVTIPQVDKWYLVHNTCTNPVTIKTAGASGLAVAAGFLRPLYCDGTAVFGDVSLAPGEAAAAAAAAASAAQASAAQAALFDPANFYTKTVADTRFAPFGVYALLDDFRTVAIQLAKLKGSTVGMAAGVVDDFRDQTGYDTTNSVNSFFDSPSNVITNTSVAASEDLPVMTSNTAPSGQTASVTGNTITGSAYLAYDGNGTTFIQADNTTPMILQRTSAIARIEGSYAISVNPSSGAAGPVAFTRWGSNNGGTTKVTLDTQTGLTWTAGQRRVFSITPAMRGSYATYGITVTGFNGGVCQIYSLESLPVVSGALDLISVAFPAQSVPTKGSIFVLASALTSATPTPITANTNFLAKISRDGGATYTAATLTSTGTLSSGLTIYEANGFDISAQPSGTAMKWRLQTVGTALNVQVDAVVAQWG